MAKYDIAYATAYKKAIKRYDSATVQKVERIIERLANDEALEPKYKDHQLKGDMRLYRECHIKPDLLLIYRKINESNMLILRAINLGSHSDLF